MLKSWEDIIRLFIISSSFKQLTHIVFLISRLPNIVQKTFCTPDGAMDPTFHLKVPLALNVSLLTGCPEKNMRQFLLRFSGFIHARRLGKVGSIALSGVQKLFCAIFGSRDISKLNWDIKYQNVAKLSSSRQLKFQLN